MRAHRRNQTLTADLSYWFTQPDMFIHINPALVFLCETFTQVPSVWLQAPPAASAPLSVPPSILHLSFTTFFFCCTVSHQPLTYTSPAVEQINARNKIPRRLSGLSSDKSYKLNDHRVKDNSAADWSGGDIGICRLVTDWKNTRPLSLGLDVSKGLEKLVTTRTENLCLIRDITDEQIEQTGWNKNTCKDAGNFCRRLA